MRRFLLSFVLLVSAASAGHAQDASGTLRGVYAPPGSAPGALRGIYGGDARPAPLPTLPKTIAAPDYDASERGPEVTVRGGLHPGQSLPEGVKPAPIPGRPGYARVVVNGRPAIIDMGDNRIVQFSD